MVQSRNSALGGGGSQPSTRLVHNDQVVRTSHPEARVRTIREKNSVVDHIHNSTLMVGAICCHDDWSTTTRSCVRLVRNDQAVRTTGPQRPGRAYDWSTTTGSCVRLVHNDRVVHTTRPQAGVRTNRGPIFPLLLINPS